MDTLRAYLQNNRAYVGYLVGMLVAVGIIIVLELDRRGRDVAALDTEPEEEYEPESVETAETY